MSNNQKRIAVAGTGYWGRNLVRCFYELGSLSAICDTDQVAVRAMGEKFPGVACETSFESVCADPDIDAIAIATPAATHASLALQAMEAGKDVFVEKPLCLRPEDGRELVDYARANGRILMVGHLLWYHPAVLRLKTLIDDGDLGRVEYIYSNRLNMGKIRREENILWSFAPHDISVILGLINETPTAVSAKAGYYLHDRIADVTVSHLEFPSGVKAHVFVSWLHPFKEQKLVVIGDKGMAVFDDVDQESKLKMYPHMVVWQDQLPVANKADAVIIEYEASEPLKAECQHFIDRVTDRELPRTDGAEGLRVLKVLEQCQRDLDSDQSKVVSTDEPVESPKWFAHESAFIDDNVEIGDGTRIWHVSHVMGGSRLGKNCSVGQNVVIGPNATVGNGVKIQNNVSVYEGVELEDDTFIGPSAVFTNVINPRSAIVRKDEYRRTVIRQGASLGANSTIVCGHEVGRYAFVAAGSVVTKDVPDFALVMGVPARISGWVCVCGEQLQFSNSTATCVCGCSYRQSDGQVTQSALTDSSK